MPGVTCRLCTPHSGARRRPSRAGLAAKGLCYGFRVLLALIIVEDARFALDYCFAAPTIENLYGTFRYEKLRHEV